jgi:hypothetical protein
MDPKKALNLLMIIWYNAASKILTGITAGKLRSGAGYPQTAYPAFYATVLNPGRRRGIESDM